MKYARSTAISIALVALLASGLILATHRAASQVAAAPATPTFSITPLLRPDGSSEPAVTIGADGTMVLSGLSWTLFQTNIWKGAFGSTPTFQGGVDSSIGKGIGGGDADVDLGSTGTLHMTTLMFFFNPTANALQLGVSAITCPHADTSNNFANCTRQIIDTTQADRQWITSDGKTVYIAYHDSGSSSTVHVQRSDDDGFTWKRVGDPIAGQGRATGSATFNNENGPIVADPLSHTLYDVYAAGEPGIQKATSTDFNHIFVSRSTDQGKSWTASAAFNAPAGTALDNIFPSLAVNPTTGKVYAVWSDGHTVSIASSTDHGVTWSAAQVLSVAPANSAIFPWVAAYNGTVDVVYYGTNAASKDDPAAVWNVYMAQSQNGGAFAQVKVSATSNHTGVICTEGTGCAPGTRNLLDLFEVAIDPQNGKAAIIYTDDTLTKQSDGSPLPQVILAQQQ
ncbi:MAG TPA: sialidase family protein [Ktedonobacterales bacterium]